MTVLSSKKTVLHVITSLEDGGAEALLYRICSDQNNKDLDQIVVSLRKMGKYGSKLQEEGIRVYCLNLNGLKQFPVAFYKLIRLIHKINPSVVQTWLYHADLIGGLAAKFAQVPKIFWSIHNVNLFWSKSKLSSFFLVKLLAFFSYWIPTKVICCARSSLDVHLKAGYDKSKLLVIYNGYDTVFFQPNLNLRESTRNLLGFSDSDFIIGMVARKSSQKDHETLLYSLLLLEGKQVPFKCILVGKNIPQLRDIVLEKKLEKRVYLLESQDDIRRFFNAFDLHILSSISEACPNVVAEAMSCGTPCIVTDVGDSSVLLGRAGIVVPPSDSESLANAIEQMYGIFKQKNKWEKLRKEAREQIKLNFSWAKMRNLYRETWFNS